MFRYAERKMKGLAVETDPFIYNDLKRMAAEKPDEFATVDLNDYRPDLSNTALTSLGDIQSSIAKGDKAGEAKISQLRTVKQMADDALKAKGINPTGKKGSLDARRADLFRTKVDEGLRDLEEKPNSKEWFERSNDIIRRLLIEGEVEGGYLSDPDKFFFEVEEGEKFFVEDVPDTERDKIRDAFKRLAKREPSEEEIIDFYTRKVTQRAR